LTWRPYGLHPGDYPGPPPPPIHVTRTDEA